MECRLTDGEGSTTDEGVEDSALIGRGGQGPKVRTSKCSNNVRRLASDIGDKDSLPRSRARKSTSLGMRAEGQA